MQASVLSFQSLLKDEAAAEGGLPLTGLERRKMLGSWCASAVKRSARVSAGSRKCSVCSSAPPQPAASSTKPFTHLSTSSARRMHHDSVISCHSGRRQRDHRSPPPRQKIIPPTHLGVLVSQQQRQRDAGDVVAARRLQDVAQAQDGGVPRSYIAWRQAEGYGRRRFE